MRPHPHVAAEAIRVRHVQHRYFAQYLRQLRSRFRLVLVAEASEVGPEVLDLFDAVSTFDTDYLFFKEAVFQEAVAALRGAGHSVEGVLP